MTVRTLRNQKGFTIFELIIVIAILGILALVLFPKMQGREQAAKIQQIEMDMLRVYESATTWKANNGKTNFAGLTYAGLSTVGWDTTKTNPWVSGYTLALDNTGCTSCSVVIGSGTLPDINVQDQLASRLAAKGYTVTKVADPISTTFRAPY